jgi:hypothetical protein
MLVSFFALICFFWSSVMVPFHLFSASALLPLFSFTGVIFLLNLSSSGLGLGGSFSPCFLLHLLPLFLLFTGVIFLLQSFFSGGSSVLGWFFSLFLLLQFCFLFFFF